MARTEKKFGTANQVSSTQVTTLVAPSANRKNVIINAAGRGTGTLDIAVTSGNGTMTLGAPTSTTSAVTTTSRTPFVTSLSTTTYNPDGNSGWKNGIAFNKELTRAAWPGLGNNNQVAGAVVNPSTGALTSIAANQYLGTGNSSITYLLNGYFQSDPMPGSNNMKIFGTEGVSNDNASSGNPGQTLWIGLGRARYNAISSSTNYKQYVGSYLNASGSWTSYTYGSYDSVNGNTYNRNVAFVTIPNHPNPAIAKGMYEIYEPEAGYGGTTAVNFQPGYGGSNPSGGTYAYISTNGPSSNNLITGVTSNVFPFTYNNQLDHWAISLSTNGSSHGNSWGTNTAAGTHTMTAVIPAQNPGFRITQDTSNGVGTAIIPFFSGTDKTPALPTGVNVPASVNQPLKSIKFSPDGTKLAVAYNRDYTGPGIAESVVVIYTWNPANTTWEHTHSSGSALPYRPYNNDCMVWAGDSSLLAIAGTDGVVRMWGPGLTASGSKVTAAISSGPAMTSLLSGGISSPVTHASTFTGSLNAGTGLTVNASHPGSWVRELVYAPTAGSPYKFVAILVHESTVALTSGDHTTVVNGVTTANVSVNNYVSSVASNLPIVDGNVTQISGVVLEANEGLAVEASVSGIVDVNAYGVEIS